MRTVTPFLLFCLSFFSLPALLAQHYYYLPNATQTPALKERHDTGINIGLSRGSGATAFELQGYYSPLNRIAVFAGSKAALNHSKEGFKYRFLEAGGGVYERLKNGSASLLVGFGRGNVYQYFYGDEFVDLTIQRWFLQPGVMYQDEFFQGGFCFRLSHFSYLDGTVAVAIPPNELETVERIEENAPFFLPELGVNAGMRLGPCSININVIGIFPRTDNLSFVRVASSIMLGVEMGNWFRKKKSKAE
jgi:hypothetical protein